MASRSPSSKIPIPESAVPSRAFSVTSNVEPSHLPLQSDNLRGPVAILWDIENCSVPSDVRPEDVAGNIRLALRVHPLIRGAVTMFSAYGDFNAFSRRLREGCQRTGVKLVDVPNGRKDAADKAILVDMFLFALDNRPPSSIMLISGDADFAPAMHILGQRGYTVILIIPSGGGVSSALCNAGQFVWDWPSIARGTGQALLQAQPRDSSDGLEPIVPPYLNPQHLNPAETPKSSIVKKKILKKTVEVVQSAAYCAVCKMDCSTQEILKSHKYGKTHKKNLQKLQDSITPKPTKAQTIAPAVTLEVAADDEEKLQCKEAKSKVVTTGPEVEVDLETKRKRVLEAGASADEVRICTICNVVVNSQKVYEYHLEGQKHAAMVEKLQELFGNG